VATGGATAMAGAAAMRSLRPAGAAAARSAGVDAVVLPVSGNRGAARPAGTTDLTGVLGGGPPETPALTRRQWPFLIGAVEAGEAHAPAKTSPCTSSSGPEVKARFSRFTNGCGWNAVSAFANCGRAVARNLYQVRSLLRVGIGAAEAISRRRSERWVMTTV
jgi:hypothetical protein